MFTRSSRAPRRCGAALVVGLLSVLAWVPMPVLADGHLAIGSPASVAAGESVLVRTTPDFDAPTAAILAPGIQVTIADGPVVGTDGSVWYQVAAWGQLGYLPTWSLSAPGGDVPAADPLLGSSTEPSSPVLDGTEAVAEPVTDPALAAPVAEETGIATATEEPVVVQTPTDEPVVESADRRGGETGGGGQAIANFAQQFAGYPYVYAGADPSGFDCSGFTMYVIQQTLGIDITHDMFAQYAMGTPVDQGSLQPGDLVFFQNTFRPGMSHNGIYIGNNQMIHAENEETGVKISDITSDYYASRWDGAVRFG